MNTGWAGTIADATRDGLSGDARRYVWTAGLGMSSGTDLMGIDVMEARPAVSGGRLGAGRCRWLLSLVAIWALAMGAAAGSSDDGGGEGSAGSMELTPGSEVEGGVDGEGAGGDVDEGGGESGDGSDDEGTEDSRPAAEQVDLAADEEAYRDELMAAIEVDEGDAGFDMECLAGRWISAVGVDRLETAGVTPEVFAEDGPTALDLTDDEALEFVRDYERCGMDLYDLILRQDLEAGVRSCIVDEIDITELEQFLVASIQDDEDDVIAKQDQISERTAHCNE